MDNKTQGAWIIHHTDKLQDFKYLPNEYGAIHIAGKCGSLLSSLAASEEHFISSNKLEVFAKSININLRMELPTIIKELEKQKLIISSTDGINVLGLTTSTTLEYTTTIFNESNPRSQERAAIELAEKVSEFPLDEKTAGEYMSDTFKLDTNEVNEFLIASNQIGFVDMESVDESRNLIFNGNLFRRDDVSKINAICSSI